jgi:sulfite exporter TauE/SafE
MKESLYYLFLSGLVLGSGPCIGFCAPVLAGFVAAYKPTLKKALVSYLFFSSAKTAAYIILGALCGIFSGILKSDIFVAYLNLASLALGFLILFIGTLTLIFREPLGSKFCSFFCRGNLKNAGLLGFLAGFSPCLPLLGILNYIIIVSHSPLEGSFYALAFGLGTSLSPLILMVGFSGKLAATLSASPKLKILIRISSGLILVYLGLRIILQKFTF